MLMKHLQPKGRVPLQIPPCCIMYLGVVIRVAGIEPQRLNDHIPDILRLKKTHNN